MVVAGCRRLAGVNDKGEDGLLRVFLGPFQHSGGEATQVKAKQAKSRWWAQKRRWRKDQTIRDRTGQDRTGDRTFWAQKRPPKRKSFWGPHQPQFCCSRGDAQPGNESCRLHADSFCCSKRLSSS